MDTFSIAIETDNAAFGDDPTHETARILTQLAYRLQNNAYPLDGGPAGAPMIDSNGNTVGSWTYAPGTVEADAATVEAVERAADLPDALDALGWTVDVQAGDVWWTDVDRARVRAADPDGADGRYYREAHRWSWRITDSVGATLSGAYWTGSAVDAEPEPADVVHSLLLDASALDEYEPDLPTGMTLDDYREVHERAGWMLDRAGDAFDRLRELAGDYEG